MTTRRVTRILAAAALLASLLGVPAPAAAAERTAAVPAAFCPHPPPCRF